MKTNSDYRPDIDGLRALAVLSVVIFHAFPGYLPGGYIGVDVFFVISGFLISGILLASNEKNTFTFRDFYIRRARRIFPALTIVLISTLSLGWFALLANEYALLGKHTFSSTFFFQNINLQKESGYFDLSGDKKPLLHLWSLSVEEQFYFILPLAVALLLQRRRSWLYCFICFSALASFTTSVVVTPTNPAKAFYSIQSRFWEMMAGGLLAYSVRYADNLTIIKSRFSKLSRRTQDSICNFTSSLSLTAIVAACFAFNNKTEFPGWAALVPVLSSVGLIATPSSWLNRKFLSLNLMVLIGLISYPLYLWHWPLLSFVHITTPDSVLNSEAGTLLKLVAVATATVLAGVTYTFIEKPIRIYGTGTRSTKVAAFITVLFVAVGISGHVIFKRAGFATREAARNDGYKKFHHADRDKFPELQDCLYTLQLKGVEFCKTSAPNPSIPDVVIIGDSHGLTISGALANYFRASQRTVHVLATGDTLGLLEVGTPVGGTYAIEGKNRSLRSAFKWAENAKTVILVSRGPEYVEGVGFGADTRTLKIVDLQNRALSDPAKIFENGLRRTFDHLAQKKIETVFIFDNPEFEFNPKDGCFDRPLSLSEVKSVWPCVTSRRKVEERQLRYRNIVNAVLKQFPQVKTFDPTESLCDKDQCFAIKDETLLYEDYNHLNDSGIRVLSRRFNF